MSTGKCFALTVMAILPCLATAAGLSVHDQSTSALGSAFAGSAALAEDASSPWYNPALSADLAGTGVSVNSHSSFLETRFFAADGTGDDATTVGHSRQAFYLSDHLTDRLSVALSVNSPFGAEREYETSWEGASYALETRVESRNINPSLAWRISPRLTLGLGASYQKLDLELRNSVYGVDLDDAGTGWNFGLRFEPQPGHRLGLAWRSKVNYNLSGTLAGGGNSSAVESDLDMPGTVSGSYAGKLAERHTLLLSVAMTEWQEVEQLVISQQNGSQSLVEELGWDNAVMASAGWRYQAASGTLLRAGYAREKSSQGKPDERAPLAPDALRQWLTVGATFRPSERLSIDVAAARVLFDEGPVERSEDRDGNPGDETVEGRYEINRTIVGAQLNYRF